MVESREHSNSKYTPRTYFNAKTVQESLPSDYWKDKVDWFNEAQRS